MTTTKTQKANLNDYEIPPPSNNYANSLENNSILENSPAMEYGMYTNEFIIGGSGDDHLYGGNGNDFLIGNAGKDVLEGGSNNGYFIIDEQNHLYVFRGDHLWGGHTEIYTDSLYNVIFSNRQDGEQNTFIFRNGNGVQTIHDYQVGTDLPIEIHGYDANAVEFLYQGHNTFIQLGDSEGILCLNAHLHTHHINWVTPEVKINILPEPVVELVDASNQNVLITGKLTLKEYDQGNPQVDNELRLSLVGHPTVELDGHPLFLHDDLLQALTHPDALSFTLLQSNPKKIKFTYEYNVPALDLDFLSEGQALTINYQLMASNQCAHSEIKNLTFTIIGTNDLPFITGTNTGFVTEDTPLNALAQVSGALIITDLDEGESFFQLPIQSFDSHNECTYTLKTVTPFDTDSILFQHKNTSIFKENTMPNLILGDGPTETEIVGTYGTFSFNVTGEWTYTLDNSAGSATDQLRQDQVVHDTLTVTSFDGTTTATIDITVTGTNDLPVIGGEVSGQITAGDGTTVNSISGTVTIADPDAGESSFLIQGNLIGNYGIFTMDLSTNEWTYTVNDSVGSAVNQLRAGEVVNDQLNLGSFDGTTPVTIDVSITGVNHVPVLGGTNTGAVKEDNAPDAVTQAAGALTISDANHDESSFIVPENLVGIYGTWTLDTAGNWTYTLDNSTGSATDQLAEGVVEHDTLTVTSFDGSASTVIDIIVTGTNDVPVIAGVNTGAVAEDRTPDAVTTAAGALTIDDADSGESAFQVPADLNGVYGAWTLDTAGNWTYTLDNSAGSPADALQGGELAHDTLTVTSFDGSASTVIDITVTGTNALPVIAGTNTGSVVEDNTPGAITTVSGALTIVDPNHDESSFQLPSMVLLSEVLSDQGTSNTPDFNFSHFSHAVENVSDHLSAHGLDLHPTEQVL